jgi:hypothetical protein
VGDVCYDYDADGILDGGSGAELVNVDSYVAADRFFVTVAEPSLGAVDLYLPKLLRTRAEADAAGEPDEYCDVLIGLPVLKSHSGAGTTGAVKLHYGFRTFLTFPGEAGRYGHSGATINAWGDSVTNGHLLDEYLCAQHRARTYDFVLMDCLTGNRRGPNTPRSGADTPVDYILTNAMMASTDPVAIDTAATLFAGYDQTTVQFLERGRLDGLGTDRPEYIRISLRREVAWLSAVRLTLCPKLSLILPCVAGNGGV